MAERAAQARSVTLRRRSTPGGGTLTDVVGVGLLNRGGPSDPAKAQFVHLSLIRSSRDRTIVNQVYEEVQEWGPSLPEPCGLGATSTTAGVLPNPRGLFGVKASGQGGSQAETRAPTFPELPGRALARSAGPRSPGPPRSWKGGRAAAV